MSLGVVIKGPEGIVLATDSRVTLEAQRAGGTPLPVNFDNATKLLSFSRPPNEVGPHNYVGAVTYGMAVIGLRTAHSYIPEFEQKVLAGEEQRLSVKDYAQKMIEFYKGRWEESMPKDYAGPPMTFVVGGYDKDAAYGRIFLFQIPGESKLEERQPGETNFGMTWGGQLEIASRLIHGFDPALTTIVGKELNIDNKELEKLYGTLSKHLQFPIPFQVLPLQDCVDLALFLIRTTMVAQRLAIGVRGVGGPIDVAVVTRTEGLRYIQQKVIHGEEYA
jgi:hypothetical protein